MHFRATKLALFATTLAITLVTALPAAADSVSSSRVRLHPYAAAAGTLPPQARAKLEALVGTGLSLSGTTRTGALDLALAGTVVWPELLSPQAITRPSARTARL